MEKRYKLWVTIEEQIEDEDGEVTYQDLTVVETRSVGTFDNVEDAIEHMEYLGSSYVNSGNAEGL